MALTGVSQYSSARFSEMTATGLSWWMSVHVMLRPAMMGFSIASKYPAPTGRM
jgi:hypothetical protein